MANLYKLRKARDLIGFAIDELNQAEEANEELDNWFAEVGIDLENSYGKIDQFLTEQEETDQEELCGNCDNIEKYANNEYPCNVCRRNETQLYGPDHSHYGDHYKNSS